jgi:hypothetical protein
MDTTLLVIGASLMCAWVIASVFAPEVIARL